MADAFQRTLCGDSPAFATALRTARLAAAADVSVLVLGETGTGKELLARAMHAESGRAAGPFVSVNCAALPETLAESHLFGHRKGAFTGATDGNPGMVAAAEGGTLFLDEVGELSASVQAKLLRFLESGEFQPVGSPEVRRSNLRVVAATNRDLEAEVRAGRFREDLYYRLQVVPVELPPLRARTGDVELLLERLSAEVAEAHGLAAPRYDRRARALLDAYSWPGNVRELRNLCERLGILLAGKTISAENLPAEIKRGKPTLAASPFTLPEGGVVLDDLEADLIRQALAKTSGNRSHAARLLGLTRDTLLYRIKKYAIEA